MQIHQHTQHWGADAARTMTVLVQYSLSIVTCGSAIITRVIVTLCEYQGGALGPPAKGVLLDPGGARRVRDMCSLGDKADFDYRVLQRAHFVLDTLTEWLRQC